MTTLILFSVFTCRLLAFDRTPLYPAALFPYTVAASDAWTVPHSSNPAYGAFLQGWHCTSYYAKPYMLERMNSGGAALSWNGSGSGGSLDYNTFGIPEYREDTAGVSAFSRVSSWLSAGARIRGSFLSIRTAEYTLTERFADLDAGIIAAPFEWLDFAFAQDNISSQWNRAHRDLAYPSWSAGFALKPAQGICFSWNLTRCRYAFINSFALAANLMRELNFRAGYSRETSSFAFSASLALGHLIASYGAGYHAFLGTTHTLSMTLASGGAEFEPMDYLAPRAGGHSKIPGARLNIATCTLDELGSVPHLSAELAARIIRYREIIGPVSRKSLVQLGVAGRALESVQKHVYGLSPDQADEKKRERQTRSFSRRPFVEKNAIEQAAVRQLFNCLLENGMPAATALRLAEMARGVPRDEFLRAVERMDDVPEESRELIKGQCGALLP